MDREYFASAGPDPGPDPDPGGGGGGGPATSTAATSLAVRARAVVKVLGLAEKKRHEVLQLCTTVHREIVRFRQVGSTAGGGGGNPSAGGRVASVRPGAGVGGPGTAGPAGVAASPRPLLAHAEAGPSDPGGCGGLLVVDVGAGQGYVSMAVALLSGVHVVGIESEAHNSTAALCRWDRARAQCARDGTLLHGSRFTAITHSVGTGPGAAAGIARLLEGAGLIAEPHSRRVLLLGLHACGDLSATILRCAVEGRLAPHVAAVISIGCCYQRLTEHGEHGCGHTGAGGTGDARDAGSGSTDHSPGQGLAVCSGGLAVCSGPPGDGGNGGGGGGGGDGGDDDDTVSSAAAGAGAEPGSRPGFPMSGALSALGLGVLGRHTRTLGAQALHTRGLDWTLRRQFFRSVVQGAVWRQAQVCAPTKLGVRLPRNTRGMGLSFADYTRLAASQLASHLGADAGLGAEFDAAAAEHGRRHAGMKDAVYVLWAARALLGGPVETLVLLDRVAFLEVSGTRTRVEARCW